MDFNLTGHAEVIEALCSAKAIILWPHVSNDITVSENANSGLTLGYSDCGNSGMVTVIGGVLMGIKGCESTSFKGLRSAANVQVADLTRCSGNILFLLGFVW